MADTVMTAKEAAEYLQLNVQTIYRLHARGEILGIQIGRSIRFKKKDLDRSTRRTEVKTCQ